MRDCVCRISWKETTCCITGLASVECCVWLCLQDQLERNHVLYYWKHLSAVGFGCICLFVFEMCERLVTYSAVLSTVTVGQSMLLLLLLLLLLSVKCCNGAVRRHFMPRFHSDAHNASNECKRCPWFLLAAGLRSLLEKYMYGQLYSCILLCMTCATCGCVLLFVFLRSCLSFVAYFLFCLHTFSYVLYAMCAFEWKPRFMYRKISSNVLGRLMLNCGANRRCRDKTS